MSITLALGHYLTLTAPTGAQHRFQNFYIDGSDAGHAFLPFGFSGITISRQGDNVDAEVVLPNNELSRSWAVEAIQKRWVAKVDTLLLEPERQTLHSYYGQVATGGWDQTALVLRLNSVLDAVGADFPHRTIDEQLCGPLPTTSSVRV